ncbi:lipopolysaccharide biosynthesis protein [Bradyrhizobium sp. F1.13.3]|uniref:lipopolysaccharide biosynthesis protein n=1 Tax=Bradyrhizobium sp. F1.13.3 TaxID=3156351 RepID=UPI003396BD0B
MALKHKAIGAALLSFSNVFRLLIQFAMLPVLARLLDTVQYGVVAIAMPFVLFAQIFADGGVGQSLVKESPDRRVVWSTSFWLILAVGSTAALILICISPLIAAEYNQPELRPIVATLASVCVAQSLGVVPSAMLQRAERFSTIAVSNTLSTAIGAGAALLLAFDGYGAWALVGQQIVAAATGLTIAWTTSGFVPLRRFDFAGIHHHLGFSRDVIAFNVINFFARSLDPLVIGKVFGAATVGSYTIAYQLMRLPSVIVTGPISSIFYTHVVTRAANNDQIKTGLLFASRLISILVFPTMGIVAVAHAPIFRTVLSQKWADSGVLFMLFAAVASIQAVTGLNGGVMMATGRTQVQIRFTVEFTIIWLCCLFIAVSISVFAVPVFYTISWFLYFPRFSRMFLSGIGCSRREYLATMLIPLLVTIAGVALYLFLDATVAPDDLMRLLGAFFLVPALIVLGGLLQLKRLRRDLSGFRHFQ